MPGLQDLDKNMPILVVDDYSTVRHMIKNCLRKLGFQNVMEAENGSGALELIKSQEFRFIISDWQMPDMMGNDLIKSVRANVRLKKVPVLMITAEQQRKLLAAAPPPESADFIFKPFTAAALQQKMESLFCAQGV